MYNWMLEQQAALNLDHAPVNCTAFMEGPGGNVNRLLIGMCRQDDIHLQVFGQAGRRSRGSRGVGMLRHWFGGACAPVQCGS